MSNTIQWKRTHLANGAVSYDGARGACTYIIREEEGIISLYVIRHGAVIHSSNQFWNASEAKQRADMFA